MKKVYLLLFNIVFISAWGQDTIIGWTFPEQHIQGFFSNLGLIENMGNPILFYDESSGTTGSVQIFTDLQGTIDDFMVGGYDWSNGNQNKYWLISFKAPEYGDFHIYSKQRCNSENPGPQDFKIQFLLNMGYPDEWHDVEGGNISCSTTWTSGTVNGIILPSEANFYQGSISIRWIMNGENSIIGEPVTSSSLSFIDQIIITAYPNPGTSENSIVPTINVYPNPTEGKIRIYSSSVINEIAIYNCYGNCVFKSNTAFKTSEMMLSLEKGVYFSRFTTSDETAVVKQLIIQ